MISRIAKRFVAGTTMHSALAAARDLNNKGVAATMDILLERPRNHEKAQKNVEAYLHLIRGIKDGKVKAGISLKMGTLGLSLDEKMCESNLASILKEAAANKMIVTIDMEEHRHKEATMRVFRKVSGRYKNVRIVVQAYLHSSQSDVAALLKARRSIRLVKGVYNESSSVAYKHKERIDGEFIEVAKMMLKSKSNPKHAFATHDEGMIGLIKYFAKQMHRGKSDFEFQMLYGVKPGLAEKLIIEGYTARVYVPYGKKWLGYVLRRLREAKR